MRLVEIGNQSGLLGLPPQQFAWGAARFVPGEHTVPHSYFHGIRWLDSRLVEVQLHGHTGGVREGNSVRQGDCFDLRYRVGRDGAVEKFSEQVAPLSDTKACSAME